MPDRPTWALIDEAVQALGIAQGLANTVARRRAGTPDERIAQRVALAADTAQRNLLRIEREDEGAGSMIGMRVSCDVAGCGRHFEVGGPEMEERLAASRGGGAVLLGATMVGLPGGWRACRRAVGAGVRVLCADHAPGAPGRVRCRADSDDAREGVGMEIDGKGGTEEGQDEVLREEDVRESDALDDRVAEGELPGDES